MLTGALSTAYAQPMVLAYDTPTMVNGVEIVCAGIGQDARSDLRWTTYPLEVVLAGEGGQYLGEAQLNGARDARI